MQASESWGSQVNCPHLACGRRADQAHLACGRRAGQASRVWAEVLLELLLITDCELSSRSGTGWDPGSSAADYIMCDETVPSGGNPAAFRGAGFTRLGP